MSDQYTTRDAARLLGVSEASVRRWSDAGLLPVQRLGRRGTRRFAEADLRRFAAAGSEGRPAPPAVAGQTDVHDHLATFYDSDAGRMRLSVPFLRAGLAQGDRCVLVASDRLAGDYRHALGNEALVVRSTVGSSARGALAAWEQLWLEALAAGHAGIRVVGEMATYKGFSEVQEMLDYEVGYDSLSKRFPVRTLCQYDVRHFDGKTILGALQAHPDLFTRRIADYLF
ncbi:MAG TPA: MEDS domain-containing protein [Candidatus Dormibacteraeota bacterium]|nr:MEDS domain-containing protein [Candidatus Dormibacteraeota bacterium]